MSKLNIDTKQCIKCTNIKLINLFPRGRRSCRSCCNNESKIYKQQHKENISAYNKINMDEILYHENKVNNYVNINNIQINKYIFNQYNKNKFCN